MYLFNINHGIFFYLKQFSHKLALLGLLVTMSGCGGGSSSGTPTPVTTTPDTMAPVITLNGESTITLIQDNAYIEQSATATDDRDGNVDVIISGTVETSTPGHYVVTYQAIDAAGNSESITREVSIVLPADTTAPVITLKGSKNLTVAQGSTYVEQGATATDARDGNVSFSVSGAVNSNQVGQYTLTYTARDKAGNQSQVVRWVTVADTTAPVITLQGANNLSLPQWNAYVEQGATANDTTDGNVSVVISGTVDARTQGSYTLTYSAVDAAGNQASIIRTIDVNPQRPFITTWKTDNSGATPSNQVMINTGGSGYNYQVDWGDGGPVANNVTGDITHTYGAAGTYQISITGQFPRIVFSANGADNNKLLTVDQWGDIEWMSMESAFSSCSNLTVNAVDAPNLTFVTSMAGMFSGAIQFNSPIGHWDVSSVRDMTPMFNYAQAFNQDIGGWDVSLVTSMNRMLDSSGLSDANYNALLIGWSALPALQSGVTLGAGFNQSSGAGAMARADIISNYGWTIIDIAPPPLY